MARLRTTSTGNNGTPNTSGNNNTVNTQVQHVVYTRAANGDERVYVDGIIQYSGTRNGNLSNWNDSYNFALANEFTNNRDWLGTLYKVAVYNKALSQTEVITNFNAGECDTDPVLANCPADIQLTTNSNAGVTANWTEPQASDDNPGVALSSNFVPGDLFPVGTTEVIYIATDCAGNTSTCNFLVTVTLTNGGGGDPCDTRVDDGLIALYNFTEGQGNVVHDVSGVGTALDLTIQDPGNVSWLNSCGLTINHGTIIKSAGAASKLNTAIKQSNEITIEAWVAAANTTQSGPARIVTISSNTTNRNTTLGQQGDKFNARLRTTSTGNNGTPNTSGNSNTVNTQVQHVVYTRAANGQEKMYVDGVVKYSGTRTGNLSNWNDSYKLALGNEFTNNRIWKGTLYKVAIF